MPRITSLKIVVVLIAILMMVGAGYAGWKILSSDEGGTKPSNSINKQEIQTEPAPTQKIEMTKIDTSDWKIYRNKELGFEVRYPGNWEIFEEIDYRAVRFGKAGMIIKILSGVGAGELYAMAGFSVQDSKYLAIGKPIIPIKNIGIGKPGKSPIIGPYFAVEDTIGTLKILRGRTLIGISGPEGYLYTEELTRVLIFGPSNTYAVIDMIGDNQLLESILSTFRFVD